MPLIDIQTNLKSLTYGEFGAEDPLVTKPIDGSASSSGIELEGVKRADDLKRITKLLTSTPAALKFAANQASLNTVEQRVKSYRYDLKGNQQTGGTLAGDVIRGVANTAKVLASTLAQIPVNGTGTHLVKGFAGKLGYLPGVQGHIEYKNVPRRNVSGSLDGIIETRGKIETTGDYEENRSPIVLEYFAKADENTPSRAETTKKSLITKDFPRIEDKGSFAQLDTAGYFPNEATPDTKYSQIFSIPSFQDSDREKPYDSITAKMPVTSSIEDSAEIDTDTDKVFEDLIKFRFKIISPQTTEGGEPSVTHLAFRAFLDSFSDDFSSDWNNFKYIGRAEDFYTYSGFNRSIQFGFKVAALSRSEVDPMYTKLNLLASSLAPTYVGDSFMRGNFATVTIGDYLINQTGFFNSVNLSWNTDYQFGGQDNDSQLPHILDVQCTFQPVHNFNPTFGEKYFYNVGNTLK